MSCGDRDNETGGGTGPFPRREAADCRGPCRCGLPGQSFTYLVGQPWLVARPPDWEYKEEMVAVAKVTVERMI